MIYDFIESLVFFIKKLAFFNKELQGVYCILKSGIDRHLLTVGSL